MVLSNSVMMIFGNTRASGKPMLTPQFVCIFDCQKKSVFLQVSFISFLIVFFVIVVFITFST